MSTTPAQQQPHSPARGTTEPAREPPQTAPEAEASVETPSRAHTRTDELRCTLCGLRACWTG